MYENKIAAPFDWIDAQPYNMPYLVGQSATKWLYWDSFNRATYDVNTGYALSQINFRSHTLSVSYSYWSRLFAAIIDTDAAIVSEFNQTSAVNLTQYVAMMYPSNGTTTYSAAVTHSVEGTATVVNPPLVIMVSFIALCFVIVAIFFLTHHYKHK